MKSFYLLLTIAVLAIFMAPHETEAQVVNLISPEDEAQVTVRDSGKVWFHYDIPGYPFEYYSVQVATDNDFTVSSLVASVEYEYNDYYSFFLERRVKYYWRASAHYRPTPSSPYVWSGWSVINEFIVIVPELLSPSDGATNQIQPIVLEWRPIIEGMIFNAGHQLWVDDDADFSSPEIDIKTTGSQRAVSGLDHNTKYYWKVRYYHTDMTSHITTYYNWSATREFTTCDVPATPAMYWPLNSATITQPFAMTWGTVSNADKYHMQLTKIPDFSSDVYDYWTTGGTSYGAYELEDGTTYYWRVRAGNECGWGDWSVPRDFTTDCPVPDPPILELPADGATDVSQPVTWDWSDVSGASKYHIQVDNDNSDFNSLVVDNSNRIASDFTWDGLADATDYWWRVRSGNDCGWSDWSLVWTFSVDEETDVREIASNELPGEFTLSQNYPNPFNPVTNIDFALPRAAHVRIEVFNILGSRVSTLVDEYLSAGYKSVEWDGRSNSGQAVSSGVYLFRITAGEFSASCKALLMK